MGPGRAAADSATADRPAGREQENAGGSYDTPYQKDQPQISPGRSSLGALRLHTGDPGAPAFGHPRRPEGIYVAIEHGNFPPQPPSASPVVVRRQQKDGTDIRLTP